MKSPTFTVITANYNSGDKLAASVTSVREQDVDVEHLIIDGASRDGSLELALRLAGQRPDCIRVTSAPDRGVYDAMNKGVHAARGRFLYFLGAGDVLRPGAMRQIQHHLPPHERAVVYGDAWLDGAAYDGPSDWRKLAFQNLCHQALFYGREVFTLLGDYDLTYRFWADYDFNLRCFGDRRIVTKYVPLVVADFELGGISRDGDAKFDADRLRLIRRHYGPIRYFRLRAFHAGNKIRATLGLNYASP